MAVVGTAYIKIKAITTDFQKEADASYQKFRQMVIQGYALGPAISVAVGGISSMVSGLVALGSQIAAALPALIVLPSVFSAIGQAAIAAKMAFSGIGAAMKALTKKGGGGGGDNSKKIEQAERRLAEVLERNREALARANDRLTEAEERLTKARDEAAESLQQLNFDAEDAAISEKKAAIELEKARETLARVQDLPPNSRARREAELAYQEADLNMRRAKDTNADLAKETEKRNKLGVEGSEEVVDATKQVQEAVDARAKAELEALRALLDAQEALNDARKGSGGGGGADDALSKLSAEARAFAEYLVSLQPKLQELRHAAGRELFGPLTFALDNIVKNLFPQLNGILTKTGAALGKTAMDFSKIVTAEDNLANLNEVANTNNDTIGKLGTVFGNLYDVFLTVLSAADPLVRRFTDWVVTLTTGWKETNELNKKSGSLTRTFKYAGDIAAQLGRALGKNGLFGAIMNIGKAAAGPGSGGEMLLDTFEKSMKKFDEFTAKMLGDGSLEKFFVDAADNFAKISTLIVEIVKEFLKLGDDSAIGDTAEKLTPLAGVIGEIARILQSAAPYLADFVAKLGVFLSLFVESKSIEYFFKTLEMALDVLIKIFSNEQIRKISLQVAAFMGIAKALSVIKFFGRIAFGILFKYVMMVLTPLKYLWKALALVWKGLKLLRLAFIILGGVSGGVATAIVVGIVALYAAVALAIVFSQKLRDALKELFEKVLNKLKDAFDEVKGALEEVFGAFGSGKGVVDGLKEGFRMFGDFLAVYWVPLLEDIVMPIIDAISSAFQAVIYVIGAVIAIFRAVYEIIRGVFSLLTGDVDGAKEHFGNAFGAIADVFVFTFKALRETFETVFHVLRLALAPFIGTIRLVILILKPVFKGIWAIVQNIVGLIVSAVRGIIDIFKSVFNAVFPVVNTALTPVIAVFKFFFGVVKTVLGFVFNIYKKVFGAFMVVAGPVFEILRVLFVNTFRIFMKVLEIFKTLFMMSFNIVKAIFIGVFNLFKIVFTAVWDFISWGVTNFGSIFSTVFGFVSSVFSTVFGFISSVFNTVWPYITSGISVGVGVITDGFNIISSVFSAVFGFFRPVFEPVWNAVVGGIQFGVGIITGLFDLIGSAFSTVFGGLADIAGKAFNGILGVVEGILNSLIGAIEWGINLAISAMNLLIKAYNAIPLVDNVDEITKLTLTRIDFKKQSVAAGLADAYKDANKYRLANGGVVSPTPGGTLAVIGEAGRPERVEPLDPDGLSKRDKAMITLLSGGKGGGITMNVYPSPGMNETELAAKISRELAFQLRRGAA